MRPELDVIRVKVEMGVRCNGWGGQAPLTNSEARELHAYALQLEKVLRDNVPHLSELVRMPNAEWAADNHNRAVRLLRGVLRREVGEEVGG